MKKSANIMFWTTPEEKRDFKEMCEKNGHTMAWVLKGAMRKGMSEMKEKEENKNER